MSLENYLAANKNAGETVTNLLADLRTYMTENCTKQVGVQSFARIESDFAEFEALIERIDQVLDAVTDREND